MMERDEIIATLRGRADEAQAICAGLSDQEMRRRPAEGEWSLLEICCHLRDTASEEAMRIRRMVEEDNPTLPLYDQDQWAAERNYAAEDPERAFVGLRAFWNGLAYLLEGLADEDWSRPGVHPEAGSVTVQPWAAAEVRHTAEHLEQMRAVREAIEVTRSG
jgi:hypothetical protein